MRSIRAGQPGEAENKKTGKLGACWYVLVSLACTGMYTVVMTDLHRKSSQLAFVKVCTVVYLYVPAYYYYQVQTNPIMILSHTALYQSISLYIGPKKLRVHTYTRTYFSIPGMEIWEFSIQSMERNLLVRVHRKI